MGIITTDDILGKTAVDPYGELLGVVVKLHIDNNTKSLAGITIDQGFTKPDLYVGMDHVKHFGVDAVMLSTIPYHKLKGLHVLNAQGELLGVVKEVGLKDGRISSIAVLKRHGSIKKDVTEILASDIKEIGQAILLKKKADTE